MAPTVFGALRRKLLARQGITARPACPCCGNQRDAGDFLTSGRCRACQSQPPSAELDAVRDAYYPGSGPTGANYDPD